MKQNKCQSMCSSREVKPEWQLSVFHHSPFENWTKCHAFHYGHWEVNQKFQQKLDGSSVAMGRFWVHKIFHSKSPKFCRHNCYKESCVAFVWLVSRLSVWAHFSPGRHLEKHPRNGDTQTAKQILDMHFYLFCSFSSCLNNDFLPIMVSKYKIQ